LLFPRRRGAAQYRPSDSLFCLFRRLALLLLLCSALPVQAVDLLVSNFTDTPDPATRGGQLVYSATITNNEADTASNAVLSFTLDAETTFVSVSDAGRCTYDGGTHKVNCNFATVRGDLSGPGSADVFTVSVTVASKSSAGATVSASAAITHAGVDTNAGNNSLNQITTVDNGADLGVTMTPSPGSLPAGGTVTYTVGTANAGPNTSGAVSLAVTLSPNLTYTSASGTGWTCAVATVGGSQVVTCTRATAAVGSLPNISIAARVTGATLGTITTAAAVSISGSATDFNNANDSAVANVTVTSGTDLAITKTASSNTPTSGAAMTFTLAPRNNGPFAATDAIVTDTLPAGFSGITASGNNWSCGVAGQTVTCTRANFPVGATDNITVTTTAPTVAVQTPYTNTATITSSTPDPVSSNDSGSRTVNVLPPGVDLSITKTKTPNPVAQNADMTSTIRVTNNGPQNASSGEVSVTDTLDANEMFISASGTNWSCAAVGQVVTCTYNNVLNVGVTAANLVLTTRAQASGSLSNTACAVYTDDGAALADPVGSNNCATAAVTATASANSIDLSITKAVDKDPLLWNENTLTYTLVVANDAGASTGATGVVITDALPRLTGSSTITAVQGAGTASATFSCTQGSTVTCTQTGGLIEAGANVSFTIAVTRPLLDTSSGSYSNTATVTSSTQGDTNPANNSATVAIHIDPVVNLTAFSSVSPASAQAGTQATYVLTVNNAGPSTASGVTLSNVFTVSAGTMTYVSATASNGGSCSWTAGTQTLDCTLGSLTSGGTATVTVVVRPDYMSLPPGGRNIANTVTVTTTTNESNAGDNTASSTLPITQASLDLLVNTTDSPDPLGFVPASAGPSFPDNVVTYRNRITNRGPSVASGMVLTYTMTPPAGKAMTFLGDKLTDSGTAYSGYCNNVNVQATSGAPLTVTCTYPGGYILAADNATTDLYLDFRVDTQPAASGDTYQSTASITSNEPESVMANNAVSQTTTARMRADLQLAKSARAWIGGADSATASVQVHQPFYWVLTLTNAGPGDSQSTSISDSLPAGVSLYTGGAGLPAPYNGAPYTAGVRWSTNNGTPTSGTCSGTTTISCSIGLLESGKVATVLVPVVSTTTGARNNCASATTSEVDPNAANNTNVCSSVTVQASSLAGTVYEDTNNDGAKAAGEAGINNVTLTLAGTDDYGNAVNVTATSNASGAFSFSNRSPGTYTLTETQPSGWLDGIDAAGSAGGTPAAVGSDSISAIVLAGNTNATGYLLGELRPAKVSGYVFVDANANATRDGGETTGVAGVTMTLTGTADTGAVNQTATTGANGSYSFDNLRPGTYQVQQAVIAGVTHTGMTVGSKGGKDGATVIAANTAVAGASKRTVSDIVLVTSDDAQNYNFGESGQALSGFVYVDLNDNGTKDAGEPGIGGVSVTLSGNTTGGASVCVAINPNPCTLTTAADGSYAFSGLPASDSTGYTLAQQSQAVAPLSYYVDGRDTAGTLGGSTAVNDRVSGIVIALGQIASGYNFGEQGATLAARVYHDKNDNGLLDGSDHGLAGVAITLSGSSAGGVNVCTLVPTCSATTAADGTVTFTGLPASNGAGYALTETQPAEYGERTNTPGSGGGSDTSAGGNSILSGISVTAGGAVTGNLFGEKSGSVSGFVYVDANNNGVKDGGETGIAGVGLTLSGTTVGGANVCTVISSCSTTTAADGSYVFANLPNAGGGGYTVSEQAQASAPLSNYLDGRVSAGSACGACSTTSTSPNSINAIPVAVSSSFTGYNFGELVPATIGGRVYRDGNLNNSFDSGEQLAGVTLTLSGQDDLGAAVSRTTTSAADGSYLFNGLRPSSGAGYTVTETQPAGLDDFAGTAGTQVGQVTSVVTGIAALNQINAIVVGSAQNGVDYNFREKTSTLAGFVYVDFNGNGIKDAGEPGLANISMQLSGTDDNGGSVFRAAATADDGSYQFTGLIGGTYTLLAQQATSFLDGRETAGNVGGTVNNSSFDGTPQHNRITGIVLTGGMAGTGYLFGERNIPEGSLIAGRVYHDRNRNNALDGDEAGIAGVTLTLTGTTSRGAAVTRTVTTGSDGNYAFMALEASDSTGYTISETQPTAYGDGSTSPGAGNPGRANATKPVAAGAADTIIQVVLGHEQELVNYNFGEVTRADASLSGRVFLDLNGDGQPGQSDAGIAKVRLILTGTSASGEAVSVETSSAPDGSFSFTKLMASGPAGYTLREVQPAFYQDGKTTAGASGVATSAKPLASGAADLVERIVLAEAQSASGYLFAELPPSGASLAGRVFVDANDNGTLDGSERGLAGVSIALTGRNVQGQDVSLQVQSGADGSWEFTGLAASDAGGYTVTETQPTGYTDGRTVIPAGQPGQAASAKPVAAGSADTIRAISLSINQRLAGYDFAERVLRSGSLAGRVFADTNGDGVQNNGEAGIAAVSVALGGKDASGNPVALQVQTTADGTYQFTGLMASDADGYTITETQPAWRDGQTLVRVGASGTPAGTKPVTQGQADRIVRIALAAGQSQAGYDFAELGPEAQSNGEISGLVYLDSNRNGVQDAGETGIAGVTVTLTGRDTQGVEVNRSVLTGTQGSFLFDRLPASDAAGYTLTQTQPADYEDGATTVDATRPGSAASAKPVAAGAADAIKAIVMKAGDKLADYRFAEQPVRTDGVLAGRVYLDANRNGQADAGESPLAGVAVALSGKTARGATVQRSVNTDAEGRWQFTGLEASDNAGYTVTETQPAQLDGATTKLPANPGTVGKSKSVAAGAADTIGAIVLASGGRLDGYDFGEYTECGDVSGLVFADTNGDGLAGSGENGIAGVTLTLSGRDRNGTTVQRSVQTGADGRFAFACVAPSAPAGYRLAEMQPAGFGDGKTSVASGQPGTPNSKKPVGTGDADAIGGIVVEGTERTGYVFAEVPVPFLKPPIVNGYVWLDRTHNRVRPTDGSLQGMANWTVELRRNGQLICTTQTDARGFYQFDNLHCPGYEVSGLPTGTGFSIVFSKEGNRLPAVAVSGGDKGHAEPTGGQITGISLSPGDAVVEQNLPLDPAGIVYDAVTRQPIPGAVVTITGPSGFDPSRHLVGAQAALVQTVGNDGLYQFLLQNDFPTGVYNLVVKAPGGYLGTPSAMLPPCPGAPVVTLVPEVGLVQKSDLAPAQSVPRHDPAACVGMVEGGAPTTQYYFGFHIINGGSAPILNNHIPLDPILADGLVLSKTTPLVNVTRGDLVPYTITATNTRNVPIADAVVRDTMPPGFQYRSGSARVDGAMGEPVAAQRTLSFAPRTIGPKQSVSYTLVLGVGAGVSEGQYVNQAIALNGATGSPISNVATATVRVVPDPTFDCPDLIGKVFDDANVNGIQDQGERGLPGIRLATPRGLLVSTDAEGRYHVPCADLPNADRGSHFVMKLDERTLPSGYRVTTENPGDVRLTRGKLSKLNFGASIHRVVRIELSAAAFEGNSTALRGQWMQQMDTVMEQLKRHPSVVRLAYRRGSEPAELAARRVDAVRDTVRQRWKELPGMYPLAIEVEDAQ
jgi:uncharacterized repeat protein (TIGR01451 family)